jgi:hypothetical protein
VCPSRAHEGHDSPTFARPRSVESGPRIVSISFTIRAFTIIVNKIVPGPTPCLKTSPPPC